MAPPFCQALAGSSRVAMRTPDGVTYLHGDHGHQDGLAAPA